MFVYSEESFWKKVASVALLAGRELIRLVMTLYYCMKDEATPWWAKAKIAGALAYFIWPADLIPDALLPIGYTDDLGVLLEASRTVAAHVTREHLAKASAWLEEVFG